MFIHESACRGGRSRRAIPARTIAFLLTGLLCCGLASAEVELITLPDGTQIAGPAKEPGYYHNEDAPPIVVVNVDCPSDSVTITEEFTSSTEWFQGGEGTISAGWGGVSAELSASFGLTIGESHTLGISLTVSADPYRSKVVKIYRRYEVYRFLVWPPDPALGYTTVFVHVPVGWTKLQEWAPPTCPCPEVQATRDQVDGYATTLPPGRVKESCVAAVSQLDIALGAFDEVPVDRLDSVLLAAMSRAAQDLSAAAAQNGDPVVIGTALNVLAASADGIVTRAIERVTTDLFDDDSLVPEISVEEATAHLLAAQSIVATAPLYGFGEAFQRYEASHRAALRSWDRVESTLSSLLCAQSSSDPNLPGDACVELDACMQGTVGLTQRAIPEAVLEANGCTGGDSYTVEVKTGSPIHVTVRKPEFGGNGKFVIHANAGRPQTATVTELPSSIGTACFDVLLPPQGDAAPIAVWNGIGKSHLIGTSKYFDATPIPNPSNGPTTFLDLPIGDAANLPVGTVITLQGLIVDPASRSPKAISVTNGVIIRIID